MNYEKVLQNIREDVKYYLKDNPNIKSLVIGISGGMDSGLNAYILKPVCEELGIKLIGRYIHIDSNKPEEKNRAENVGVRFCNDFLSVDLTDYYNVSLPVYKEFVAMTKDDKLRRGNIKARIRMIYLYNLAQKNSGIVIDNDNRTEHELGFWTLNGDVGDITPLACIWKSEIYDMSKWIVGNFEKDENKIEVLNSLINAVPTDGLGISESDLDQIGAPNYYVVDEILKAWLHTFSPFKMRKIYQKYDEHIVNNVILRHENSKFKRNHPYKIYPF